jgi:hypothetical protein
MIFSGVPHVINPPIMIVAPSLIQATASSAVLTLFFAIAAPVEKKLTGQQSRPA